MKRNARSYFTWYGLNKDIDDYVRSCESCQNNARMPSKEFSSWPISLKPWEKVYLDFAGPFLGKNWLIIVDSFSYFFYVFNMKNTDTRSVCKRLMEVFLIEGLPVTLVSDNGPQFISVDFRTFCNNHGIKHLTSTPFHPESNGEAEKIVKTFKNSLKKQMADSSINVSDAVDTFLLTYRFTPLSSGKSPAELLHKCEANNIWKKVGWKEKQNRFISGDAVWFKCFTGEARWYPGRIIKKIGSQMFMIEFEGSKIRRHRNQIRRRKEEKRTTFYPLLIPELLDVSELEEQHTEMNHAQTNDRKMDGPLRRSDRTIKVPQRYSPVFKRIEKVLR